MCQGIAVLFFWGHFRTFSDLKKTTFWLSFYYFLNRLILSYIVLALCTPYLNKNYFILIEISKLALPGVMLKYERSQYNR